MGYLDNSSITVDAVLTKKGREILKNGGDLKINSFTTSDTGVDYSLWNPDHPSGSAHYGEDIENMPMLEASVHAEFNLRNRLVSLNQKTIAIPALVIGGMDVSGGNTITFNEGDSEKGTIHVQLVGFSSTNMTQHNGYSNYFIIQDPSIVGTSAKSLGGVSGTGGELFLQDEDMAMAHQYGFNGKSFHIKPKQQDKKGMMTSIYVVNYMTGAWFSFEVVNNITKDTKSILSTVRSGNITP